MTMTFTIDPDDWRKVLAEVVGTFFFFFIGIGGALVAPGDLLFVGLAHGIALALAISALGHVSGGHFNPAVTIGMAVARRISPALAIFYIIGQIAGGVAACLALVSVLPANVWQGSHLATPQINTTIVDGTQSTILEGILTFFLVLAVFGTAVDKRAARIGGFGIGLTVFVDILVGGFLSGGVMNPARALAPAIVSSFWQDDQFVYWIGPILGAIVAALLYSFVFLPKDNDIVTPAPAAVVEPPLSEPTLAGPDEVVVVEK